MREKPRSDILRNKNLDYLNLETSDFGKSSFEHPSFTEERIPITQVEPEMATLKTLLNPTRTTRPSCIRLADTEANYELKPGMLQMLPIFLGKENENPYFHVRDFEEICSTLKIRNLDDDALKLR